MIAAFSSLIAGEIKLKDRETLRTIPPSLSVGEIIEATVKGKQGDKYIINVKGMTMEASSGIPLSTGQKITVQIRQLHPQILMLAVKGEEVSSGAGQFLEHVRNFKQDQSLLKQIFQKGKDIFSQDNMARYRELMPTTDFQAMKDRLESLIFAKDTLTEYAGKLGLLHEHALYSGAGNSDNLKAVMMRLQEDIEKVTSEKGAAGTALAGLSDFAATTVARIETCQAVNLLSMDRGGMFFLPLSFLFNGEFRAGEFYASKTEGSRGKALRAVLFLDMNNLGKMMADIKLTDDSIRCAFRCEDSKACNFLADRIDSLTDGLAALGYRTSDVKCYHERNMDAVRRDVLDELPAYSERVLNITV